MPVVALQVTFYYLAAVSVASALLAVTRKNPVHSMLWVLALFVHVAGLFLIAGAEFVAAVQIIVYAGAILVFYLFFLMLTELPSEASVRRFGSHWPLCLASGLAFVALTWYAHQSELLPAEPPAALAGRPAGHMSTIGMTLFTEFALPFEIASLVLLAAIVGAVVVAKRKAEPR
jgi:NADH-quinone oxidoreductase subunit J